VLVKPGTPFSIVENIQSHRKTPTTLFIKDDERVYGMDAINKKIRNPQNTFVYPHQFLGKRFGDSEVKTLMEKYFMTFDLVEDNVNGYLKN
jgi:molecular chaperone DnaK (HSP70)